MADEYTARFTLTGEAAVDSDLANRQAFQSFQIGQDNFTALNVDYSTDGDNVISRYYVGRFTIAPGSSLDIDLDGSLQSDLVTPGTVVFAAVKELLIAIVEPDGTKKVLVGPQGLVNGWVGPWGSVDDFETVVHHTRKTNPYDGFEVIASTGDVLRIHNPGASEVFIDLAILGV